jgi:uncharacterized membrane protein YfcA
MITPAQHVAIAAIALVGGAANSIAGGGMLMTFPALVALGVPSLTANATCTVALWPGILTSLHGYRAEIRSARRWAIPFLLPSVAGGLVGGVLLTVTPQHRFDQIIPFLVGFATLAFVLQQPMLRVLRHWSSAHKHDGDPMLRPPPRMFVAFQFFVAIYGGYFGGGAGIIMLAAFGLMGLTNIHQMNGLKNLFALTFNFVAIGAFVVKGLVSWPAAITMGAGSMVGGAVAARIAQRVPQGWVKAAVGVIGFTSAMWLFYARK